MAKGKKNLTASNKTSQKVDNFSSKNWIDSTRNQDIIFFAGLLVLMAIIYILRSNFIDIPLERDEGDYALAGKLILEGVTPYVGVFEQKPPGLFYGYAIISFFFGTSVAAIKIGFVVVNMLTVTLIAFALKFLFNPLAAFIGAFTFAILSLNPYASGYSIQAEHVLILYVSIAFFFLCHYLKKGQLYALIIAGASVAWSATIKQNGLFFIIAFSLGVIAIHFAKGKLEYKKLWKELIYFAFGGIGMAIFVLLIMAAQGVWKEFIFWSITFPREFYLANIPFKQGMTYMENMYGRITEFDQWIWYAAAGGIVFVFVSKLRLSLKIWIVSIVLLSFFSIWPGLRFYGHYWIQLFFGLSISLAALAYSIQNIFSRFLPKFLSALIVLLVFLAFALSGFTKHQEYYMNPNGEALMNAIYGDNPFMEMRKIAEFINSKNPDKENDKLVILGSEPQILLETGLKSPTPHTFLIFVASTHPVSATWRTEYLEMLRKNEAKYAVFVSHPFSWLANNEEAVKFVTEIYNHLRQYYKVIGVADILSTEQTIYKWDEEAANYPTSGSKFVLVLEKI